jgi:hypothetical protein
MERMAREEDAASVYQCTIRMQTFRYTTRPARTPLPRFTISKQSGA